MAYKGFLLKLGGETGKEFSKKYIFKESYQVYINAQDLNSERNANGKLNRNVLDHTATTISFSSKPMWNDGIIGFDAMMKFISDAYTSPWIKDAEGNKIINPERKLDIYYYIPEFNVYRSGTFYLVQPQPKIMQINGNRIMYDEIAIEFIEY